MSNFLGIATVTAALSQVLQAAIGPDVPGATATTLRPDGTALPTTGLNIFLYQVTPNASWSNADLPTRRSNGDLVQRPQVALDLHYLLTFYGDDARLEPQRVLGSAVRALHDRPVLTREIIRQTIAKPVFGFLVTSNLADAIELVKFTPLPLSLEELSKLWSVYFQTHYSLSIAYQGTVVLIESEVSTRPALPVHARNIYAAPFRQPLIEAVDSQAGSGEFIVAGATVVITGQRLRGEVTQVAIGGLDLTPALEDVGDRRIRVKLPDGIHAGVQGLQVVQPRLMGTPPVAHRGVESNLAAFVLHPAINRKGDGTPDVTVTSTTLTAMLAPKVGKTQRVSLVLNELNPPGDRPARAFSVEAAPHNRTTDPEETDTLVFPIAGIAPGTYLVRAQVDGAESALDRDPDESNPVFVGPKVTIP